MLVELKILDRGKTYGYLYWTKSQDKKMRSLLDGLDRVQIIFRNADHGEKRIDWRYRRISLGQRWTRQIPASMKLFVLKMSSPNSLKISCK